MFLARILASCWLVGAVLAQEPAARKSGVIYRGDVDALVARVSAATLPNQTGAPRAPLGGDSVLATAQVLCAMGHCHRRYHVSDGPVVRSSLEFLRGHRRTDGSYGDAVTTAWVAEALHVVDPDGTTAAAGEPAKVAAGPASGAAPFEAAVTAVLAGSGAGHWPQEAGRAAAQRGRELLAAGNLVPSAAAEVLVQLVACQVANQRLDQAAATVFSPAQQRGLDWLFAQQKGGVFGPAQAPSIPLTGFALMALQSKPASLRTVAERAAIEQGLRWLLARQNDDGTWGESLQNYTTCAAVGALRRWSDPAVAAALAKANRALLAFQNAEQNGYQPADRDYGSIGYGGAQRGDLSNLHFAMQALRDSGSAPGDEAFAKAVVFLQRTQNLRRHNDFSGKVPDPDAAEGLLDVTSGDDGGAGYYPGNSSAGYNLRPDGKVEPRSYGSMTYALLKAYTLAGVAGDDERVVAAVRWIRDHWNLEVNPGVDPAQGAKAQYQGLYYSYMLLAQALDLGGIKTLEVPGAAGGPALDWRAALRQCLEGQQGADGNWVNRKNPRWLEGESLLCTCYALLALERCVSAP